MATDKGRPLCPVCQKIDRQDALQSSGVVLSGAMAMFNGDLQAIQNVYDALTPLDAHVAITMYCYLLDDMTSMFGVDPLEYLQATRRQLIDEQASAYATSGGADPDGTGSTNNGQ